MTRRGHQLVLVLSCEHAGNRVPRRFADLFAPHAELLATHRGWDPGALPIARELARTLRAPLTFTPFTRLLIEPNRSPHHPALFSAITRELDDATKKQIFEQYYEPHRGAVRKAIATNIRTGRLVLHVGVHTFTPALAGETRNADIGLLYDPRRRPEREICDRWAKVLREIDHPLRVRKNYPYRGAADGLTTSLRREFPATSYLGIELEINQALAASPDAGKRREIARTVARSLAQLLDFEKK